jgi:uncharacterized DUF497 family protein
VCGALALQEQKRENRGIVFGLRHFGRIFAAMFASVKVDVVSVVSAFPRRHGALLIYCGLAPAIPA